jgi:hypothetical protein
VGYGHIMLVREDAINELRVAERGREQLAEEVGRAVLKRCVDKERVPDDEGRLERLRSAAIFNHGSGVMWAGERHTHEEDLFVWAGNSLKPIGVLDVDTLERVRQGVERAIAKRQRADESGQDD